MNTEVSGLETGASTTRRLPVGLRFGALGLAVPLIGGRWGAYIGIAPIYLADLLLAIGVLCTFVMQKNYPRVNFSKSFWFLWTATVVFIVVSLLLGEGGYVTRARDLIPWYYLLMLPAVMQWALAAGRRRILNFLTVTLLAHAAWAIPALAGLLPEADIGLGIFGEPWFSERPDVDVPLLAAAGVLVFYRWGTRATTVGFALLAAGAGLAQTSRAALVGGAIAVGVFGCLRGRITGAQGVVRLVGVSLVALVTVLVLLPMLSARPADRFDMGALARAGLYGSATAQASGSGTANDRYDAWGVLLNNYADNDYPALGAGAGAEIIRDTGTVQYFGGDIETRAPHSWWVHVLIRTGYVGTILWVGLLVTATRPMRRVNPEHSEFPTAMGAMLVTSILLTSTFGVVVEAPFGSQILLVGAALLGLRLQRNPCAVP